MCFPSFFIHFEASPRLSLLLLCWTCLCRATRVPPLRLYTRLLCTIPLLCPTLISNAFASHNTSAPREAMPFLCCAQPLRALPLRCEASRHVAFAVPLIAMPLLVPLLDLSVLDDALPLPLYSMRRRSLPFLCVALH